MKIIRIITLYLIRVECKSDTVPVPEIILTLYLIRVECKSFSRNFGSRKKLLYI